MKQGNEGSAAGGGRSDPSERPGSIADAAASSARKISGTATGHKGSNCKKPPEGLAFRGLGFTL